jgi:hypothetical protein
MAVVLEDLPPLLRHAELGRSLPDVWTGRRPRNAFDPGSSWSGDDLRLLQDTTPGPEIPVAVPGP